MPIKIFKIEKARKIRKKQRYVKSSHIEIFLSRRSVKLLFDKDILLKFAELWESRFAYADTYFMEFTVQYCVNIIKTLLTTNETQR